jgi:hypothetical protein
MITASWRSVGIAVAAALAARSGAAQLHSPTALLSLGSAMIAGGENQSAEPPKGKARGGEELEAMSLLAKVAAAYAEAATHERVAIRFAGPDGQERFDQMQVSMDPGLAGAGRRLAVSMGSLRVQVVEGLVSAVSESAVGRVFRAALGGDLSSASMARVLPPLPIPSLEFLGGRDVTSLGSMTPYARGIVWESRAEMASPGETWAVVRGAAGDTRVALTIDLQSWRVRHVEILGRHGSEAWSLDCSVTPIIAPEHDPFAPLADSLQPVATLAELVAAQLPLAPGARVPSLTLMDTGLRSWTLGDAFADGPKANRAAVLILYRAGSEAARADAQAAALAVTQNARRLHASIEVHPVMVYELREFQVSGMQRETSHWDGTLPILASTGGRELLDRFAPGRNAAVVVIDRDHCLLGALDCDGRSSDVSGLGVKLRDLLASAP